MKITISYSSNNKDTLARFDNITRTYASSFLEAKTHAAYQFKYKQSSINNPQEWNTWFDKLADSDIDIASIKFHADSAEANPLLQQISGIRTAFLDSRCVLKEEAKTKEEEAAAAASNLYNADAREAEIVSLSSHLAEWYQTAIDMGENAHLDDSSKRLKGILLAVHKTLDDIKRDYLSNQCITKQQFSDKIRQTLTKTFLYQEDETAPEEAIDLRDECSRHPQWNLNRIIDNILWFIDIYRLVTGERLSIFKVAEPAARKHYDDLQADAASMSLGA